MKANALAGLSRRERQIMDVIYRLKRASAAEVQVGMPEPPSYSSVRAQLVTLETKGLVRHSKDGSRCYFYYPTQPRDDAARLALRRLLLTFFDGSVKKTVNALLHVEETDLNDEELQHLRALITQAEEEGR